MCSCCSEQSTRFKLSMMFFIVMLITGATLVILGIVITHDQNIKLTELGFAFYMTGVLFIVLSSSCNKSQTDENTSSTPTPPPLPTNTGYYLSNFSRSHQLRQSSNAQLSRQHGNFRRIGTGNTGEVILSCTDWETFGNYSKASETSDKEESCAICFEPLTSRGRLVPCGHASFCYNCSQKIYKQDDSRCPLCRTEIQQVNLETVIFIRK